MDRRVSIFKQNKHAGKLNIVMTFLVIIYRHRRFQKRIQISENKIQTNKNAQACGSCDGCYSVSAEDDWYTIKITYSSNDNWPDRSEHSFNYLNQRHILNSLRL